MTLRLPGLSSTPLPTGPALLPALRALEAPREGYLQVSRSDGSDVVVFFYAGNVFCAGVENADRFFPIDVDDLAAHVEGAVAARVVVTDLALFLCGAVLFRKAPSAHVPANLVDGETVLKNVAARGFDAVVVIARASPTGSARSFCFCRGGKPVKLYVAEGEEFAADGSIADRIVDYVYRHGSGVSLDIYDDIRLQTAKALAPLSTHLAHTQPPAPAQQPAWLVVRLGGRVVFRFPVVDKDVVVGRGEDADLVLDNLSVSRTHARVARDGAALVVDDLNSENGLVQDGERKERVVLQPGDEVDVGKYTLAYSAYAAAVDAAPVWPPRNGARPVSSSGVETVAVSKNTGISLEHGGKQVRVPGAVFVIGAGDAAHLKIDGWFVADTHVVLAQHSDGWKATWSAGLRALRVNGIKTRQARLVDGDVLAVGSHVLVFRAPSTSTSTLPRAV